MFEPELIPLPDLSDPNFVPFWEGTREHQLRIQQCEDCGTHRWPPRTTCRHCRSTAVTWVQVEPKGHVYSYTIVGRPTTKGYANTPYAVAIVALDTPSNVRIIGSVTGIEPSQLVIGMALEGRFVPIGPNGEITLMQWAPAGTPA
ncbi:Zn-ribbon domain-containing OB-fold protein [Devosia sp. Root635]|uniref:Zn-ribbon domain-containing OB-fold protein n=1 Tax=Devosia sp. Root635 TaxID=1736575 RepID=UPI0006FE6840|nr:zinc ribbon domain-containing protein [Devosia sp. Root635]KRA50329.1 hypothetical protein ASD80_16300 [Devosia sp. Root635]